MQRTFIATLIVFQALLVIVHVATYGTLHAAFGVGAPWLQAVFVALAFSFVAASLLSRWRFTRAGALFYTAAAYWFGLVHFLFIGGALFLLVIALFFAANIYVAPALVGGICFGVVFLIHLYGTWNSGRLLTTTIRPELPSVPARLRGKRIVFVSDLHLGALLRTRFAERAVEKIQALQPEAVFIGGDLYDGPACDVRALIAPFKALRPPLGTYYITGNHEYYLPAPKDAIAAVAEAGMRVLNDEQVEVGGLTVVGVDYLTTKHRENFKATLAMILQKTPGGAQGAAKGTRILLKHEPSDLDVARDAGIDLTLAGHTHAGQIFPLNLLTRRIYRGFDYGFKALGEMRVFTSSGAGTWGPPLRLGTRSEIVCMEL